jgi:AcrR family transcriptional regulator
LVSILTAVVYDSAATKARLLDAAYDEFVERGLAGARVDRIAAAASANKQAIYAYFGSKEALFDTVLHERHTVLADAVPFTAEDFPGYAAALFDYLRENPGQLRLAMWKQLERPHAGESEVAAYRGKVEGLGAAYDFERGAPLDLVLLSLGTITGWMMASPEIRALDDDVDRHRDALVASLTATFEALAK